MKKAIAWIKKNAWVVLGAIVAVLAVILGVKYEKRKVDKLKGQIKLAEVKSANAVDTGTKEAAKKYETRLEVEDNKAVENISQMAKDIKEVRENVEKLQGSKIANEFNNLYGNSSSK
jgi:predicted Holliday junction resolvase-like endonuclease